VSAVVATKEVGLEVNAEKTKYMLLSRHRNAGQNHDIHVKIGNRCFENVVQFRYLGTTITNQNLFRRKLREIELGYCLLPFSPEMFSSLCCLKT
jgi:hypothetical protein